MKVTLLRHAESRFNVDLSDEADVDLTEVGRQQAASLSGDYETVSSYT